MTSVFVRLYICLCVYLPTYLPTYLTLFNALCFSGIYLLQFMPACIVNVSLDEKLQNKKNNVTSILFRKFRIHKVQEVYIPMWVYFQPLEQHYYTNKKRKPNFSLCLWCRKVCLCTRTGVWMSRECVVTFILTEPSHDFYWNPIIVGWELCLWLLCALFGTCIGWKISRNGTETINHVQTEYNEKWCQIKYTHVIYTKQRIAIIYIYNVPMYII